MPSPLIFRCARCGAMNRIALLLADRQAVCGKCQSELDTSGAAHHVDVAALESAIASSPVPVLVDFWAPWCGPCRAFAPVLERFAHEQAGRFVVLKLDTDADPTAGARFGIRAVPTLAVFVDGKELERVAGALPLEELRRFAAQASLGLSS